MRVMDLVMMAVVLWTLVGVAGTAVALMRGERRRARQGLLWLGGVWVVYVTVLVGVSLAQPGTVAAPGVARCFDEMCFTVAGVEEVQGFAVRGEERERLVRVSVRVENRGRSHAESERGLRTYLTDAQGRRWTEVPGLSGVRLTTLVAAGGVVVSQPVFQLPRDANGLGLVLVHDPVSPDRITIGDPESWLHRPEVMLLPGAPAAARAGGAR